MRRACQAEDGWCRPVGVVGSCTFKATRRNRNGARLTMFRSRSGEPKSCEAAVGTPRSHPQSDIKGAERFPPQPNGANSGAVMGENRVQHGAAPDCKEMKSSVLNHETQRGCASSCEPAQPSAKSINGRSRIRTYEGKANRTVSPQNPGAESGAVGANHPNATTPEVRALLDALLSLPPSARAEFLALIQRTDSTACRT